MIIDTSKEERVPVNEIKNFELSELGLLIVNECIEGNYDYAYDTLLPEFIELSKYHDTALGPVDLNKWGLKEVEVNTGFFVNKENRKIPQLKYVFKKSTIESETSPSNPEKNYQVVNFVDMLRDAFVIQGGLRAKDYSDKVYVEDTDEIHVMLDFMEYKCNELYKKYGGRR